MALIRTILALSALFAIAGAKAQAVPGKVDMGFDLQIRLSEPAAQTLKRQRESLIVSASYYGDPTVMAKRYANEVGLIDLGRETVTLAGRDGAVRLTGDKVDRNRIGWLSAPPMVNVNVFTARRSGPDNLLACDVIDGPVARVAARTITLTCTLITEKREVAVYPR